MRPHGDSSLEGADRNLLQPPDRFGTPTSKGIKKNCKCYMAKWSLKFTSTMNEKNYYKQRDKEEL